MYYHLETEITIIASAIIKKENLIDLLSLSNDDFYDNKCKILFEIISDLHNNGNEIDIPVLQLKIKELGYDNLVTTDFFLTLISQHSVFDMKPLVNKIKELSEKRKLYNLSNKIKESTTNKGNDQIINDIHDFLKDIDSEKSSNDNFISDFSDYDISEFKLKDGDYVKSHLESFNKLAYGHIWGDLSILAGRPGSGKTTFALEEALFASQFVQVDFYTLEVSVPRMILKAIGCLSGVNTRKIQSGNLTNTDRKSIKVAMESFKKRRLNFIDKYRDIDSIKNSIRRNKIKHGTRFVVLDHLLHVQVNSIESKRVKIGIVTSSFMALKIELNICLLILTQLNRLAESDTPNMSHLAESGATEQDADNIYFIYNKKVEDKEECWFILGKVRMGETGFLPLVFNKAKGSFQDLYYGQENEWQQTNRVDSSVELFNE